MLPLGLGLAKLEFLWVMLRLDTMAKEVSSREIMMGEGNKQPPLC